MKYDALKAGKLLAAFKQAQKRLQELARLPENDFLADPDKIGSAKYQFIVAIEAAIDLSNHIIAQNNWRIPEDYADTFRVLGEAGIFPPEFVGTLISMARFRNRLVHIYWDVDNNTLYSIMKNGLKDLDIFLKTMVELFSASRGGSP
ncbi:type VII toxin-antitoxin system HepT family RNase toxin [Moorella sulfitireducens]|uniref:type VII toxin-antitoxin system HepT family RNase toxin n=1 Tax=Neomoorella sulfitireducens TaxID=2972948 RepID=UPI0021AC6CB4|nr:DUF86 domain-containing protein [Moorella sulfitireducens]